ncbi:MAG TPA: FMN-binding protein [Mycobacteriales bacterium]|nr:FMN-binding protein [Mycobacteriales bacterium]
MRQPVLAVMSGLTVVVLALGIRAGATHGGTVAGRAPVGVVATPGATGTSASTTVNGAATGTRYGPVQVQITVQDHRITRADAIVYPTQDPRDQEINGFAVPQLDAAVLQAQSAQVDTVSGATFTSEGYLTSLQSALDQARSAGLL